MKKESNDKEDLRIQRTKHLLRESIAILLEKKDLKDISIQQLSKKAMIYRTTFYAHYNDKYELMEDYLMETWKKEVDLNGKIENDINEEYWKGILETVQHFKNYAHLYIQLNENRSIISESNLIYSTIKKFFIIWLDIIQNDDSKALVPKEKISDFYVAGYLNLILDWLLKGTKESCESMTDMFIALTDENLKYILKIN